MTPAWAHIQRSPGTRSAPDAWDLHSIFSFSSTKLGTSGLKNTQPQAMPYRSRTPLHSMRYAGIGATASSPTQTIRDGTTCDMGRAGMGEWGRGGTEEVGHGGSRLGGFRVGGRVR